MLLQRWGGGGAIVLLFGFNNGNNKRGGRKGKCFSEALLFFPSGGVPGWLVLPGAAGCRGLAAAGIYSFRGGRSKLRNNLRTCLITPVISVPVCADKPKDRGSGGEGDCKKCLL